MDEFELIKLKGKTSVLMEKLPYHLRNMYGDKKHYSRPEIDAALDKSFGKNHGDAAYAYSLFMFMSELESCDAQSTSVAELVNYKKTIAKIFFEGNRDFNSEDIEKYRFNEKYVKPTELDRILYETCFDIGDLFD